MPRTSGSHRGIRASRRPENPHAAGKIRGEHRASRGMRAFSAPASGCALAATTVMIEIRHILCPVDLSDTSLRALQHSSALARWYESSLTAFYVDTTLPIENAGDFASAPPTVIGTTRSRALQDVRTFATRASSVMKVDVAVRESPHV